MVPARDRQLWERIWSGSSYSRPARRASRARAKVEALSALGIDLAAGGRVLDLACGSGHVLLELAARIPQGAHRVACDRSTAALHAARSVFRVSGLEVPILQADAAALPLRTGSCDLVLASMVLHHLREPAKALSEIERVLAADGRLLVVVPSPYSLASFSSRAREAMDLPPYDGRRYTAEQLVGLLQTQFVVEACRSWQLGFDRPLSALADRALGALIPGWGRYLVARCRRGVPD